MNTNPIEQLWDRYRDHDVTDSQKAEFEAYLRQNPKQRALFDAETRWLDCLAQKSQDPSMVPDESLAFSNEVLAQWSRSSRWGKSDILGRIHWRSALVSTGGILAAAAVALAIWIGQTPSPRESQEQTSPMAVVPPDTDLRFPENFQSPVFLSPPPRPHPLTQLMQNVSDTYEQEPNQVYRVFEQARNMVNLSTLADRFEVTPIQPIRHIER